MRTTALPGLAVLAIALCLTAFSPAAAQLWGVNYQFVPHTGFYNNLPVYYLMTDVSDATWASTFKVNYTPKLAQCLSPSIRPNGEVHARASTTSPTSRRTWCSARSGPRPDPANPGDYMPTWILYTVTWDDPAGAVVLDSVAEIEAAETAGDVTITQLNVVVGASIIINSAGQKIRQAYDLYEVWIPSRPAARSDRSTSTARSGRSCNWTSPTPTRRGRTREPTCLFSTGSTRSRPCSRSLPLSPSTASGRRRP